MLALASIWIGIRVYHHQRLSDNATGPDQLQRFLGTVFSFLDGKWYVDEFYDATIVRLYEWKARFLAFQVDWVFWHDYVHDRVISAAFRGGSVALSGSVDKGGIDRFFDGLAHLVRVCSERILRPLQTGYVRNYALGVMLGVIVVLGIIVMK
jgi:NADH-quinone oxidoreductase subunit L